MITTKTKIYKPKTKFVVVPFGNLVERIYRYVEVKGLEYVDAKVIGNKIKLYYK